MWRAMLAARYAGLLEATMEHVPHVCPIEPEELLEFCTDAGYTYRVEALGSLLMPPDYYVGITDWEPPLRLRGAHPPPPPNPGPFLAGPQASCCFLASTLATLAAAACCGSPPSHLTCACDGRRGCQVENVSLLQRGHRMCKRCVLCR